MSVDLSTAYVIVRDLDADGCPVLPSTWHCTEQDAGWHTLERDSDGLTIAAWRASAVGARGLFALFAPEALLAAIATTEPACMPAREAWARRAEPTIRAYLRYWPIWRIDGHVRDSDGVAEPVTSAVVRLVPEGVAIPDPSVTALPWLLRADGTVTAVQAEAAVRVATIHRPALDRTLAGFDLHAGLEDEPERT